MKSWPNVAIPALEGRGRVLHVRDTGSGVRVPILGTAGIARMYVCGITPYDATHLGHAATYVTFDVINRVLRDRGLEVRYIQNVTDVDDPLLERAARDGVDWTDLATQEIALFREDMTALAVLPPDELVGVVESVDLIAEDVHDLVERGVTYSLGSPDAQDNDVYLDLRQTPGFGGVSRWPRSAMFDVIVERGGDPDRPGKRDPLDPLLWRAARPHEPSWAPAGLAPGRPGWHIECTAIAADRLGLPFDIQGGGTDLIFPHHEMSATQAEVTSEAGFARAYVHQAMVGLDGAKMSKSKGNLVLVSTLRRDGVDAMAIRLLLLAHHYSEEWSYTDADLASAQERLTSWRASLAVNTAPPAESVIAAIRQALADDLDTPTALAAVDAWAHATARGDGGDANAPGVVARGIDALLGIRV